MAEIKTDEAMFKLFREAIAWGYIYGPELNEKDYEELRDDKARILSARAIEAAVLSANAGKVDDRGASLERLGFAINRACAYLPIGWQLDISLEKDAGTITLYNPDGEGVELENGHEFANHVNEHIDYAIAAAPTQQAIDAGKV